MNELKPGDELPYQPPQSIEEVLSSIRLTAASRNWTPQQVSDTFSVGMVARQMFGVDPSAGPDEARVA